jgi:hypothetical protein
MVDVVFFVFGSHVLYFVSPCIWLSRLVFCVTLYLALTSCILCHPVFGSNVLYSRDLQFFPYDFASYFVQSCVLFDTSYKRISAASRPVMSRFAVTDVSLPYSTVGLATTVQKLHVAVCTGCL